MQDEGIPEHGPDKFTSVINWWAACYASVKPELARRARRTVGAILMALLGFMITGVILFATGQGPIAIPSLLAAAALLFCVIALRKGASIDRVVHAFIAISATVLFGMLLATGGSSVGFLIATPVVPALAALIGNRRLVLFWSFVTAAVIAAIIVLTWFDFAFPIQPDPSQVRIAKFFIAIVVVGIIVGVAELFMDDQQRVEQSLQESAQLLKQAARTANLGHYVWDELEDRYLYTSEEFARILGVTVDEIFDKYNSREADLELVHPDDREYVLETFAKFDNLRHSSDLEYRIVRPNGEERYVREIGDAVLDDQGRVIQTIGILQDITELRHIQERSRKLQDAQRALTKNLSDARRAAKLVKLGTYVWDWNELRLVSCSEEYARIHEMSVSEALQTFTSSEADFSYIHPDDRDRIAAIEGEAVAKREGYGATYRLLLPSGRVRHIREVCEIEFDEQSGVCRTLGSVQDVSEQVELEEQLRQARKMEAVGQLTSGIAHDFNNILAVVMGNLDLAIESNKEGNNDPELLAEAMRGAQRGADLNKRLLTFSRQQVVAEKVLNVNEIIDNMSSLLARTLGEQIEIETVFSEDNCLARLDPALLESAILNLAINARDAMPSGGKLRIKTGVQSAGTPPNIAAIDREMICIAVSDSGLGMTDEVRERAIEPFYTTKEVGAGSGLGLSMVYGFVSQAGGRMEIETELTKGTTIYLVLPISGGRDNMLDEVDADEMPPAIDGETILVIEDQRSVRQVVVRQLNSLGYEVLAAESGNAAIQMMETNKSINLILSDLVMPGGMGGEEVAMKAKEIRPRIKILFMSGNPVRSDRTDSKIEYPLLRKPFRKVDLAQAIRLCLDRG